MGIFTPQGSAQKAETPLKRLSPSPVDKSGIIKDMDNKVKYTGPTKSQLAAYARGEIKWNDGWSPCQAPQGHTGTEGPPGIWGKHMEFTKPCSCEKCYTERLKKTKTAQAMAESE